MTKLGLIILVTEAFKHMFQDNEVNVYLDANWGQKNLILLSGIDWSLPNLVTVVSVWGGVTRGEVKGPEGKGHLSSRGQCI